MFDFPETWGKLLSPIGFCSGGHTRLRKKGNARTDCTQSCQQGMVWGLLLSGFYHVSGEQDLLVAQNLISKNSDTGATEMGNFLLGLAQVLQVCSRGGQHQRLLGMC